MFTCSCPKCDYKSSHACGVKRHLRTVHLQQRPHACSQPGCTFSAAAAQDLRIHVESVHLKKRDVACPHCDYRAAQVKLVNGHIRRRHIGMSTIGKKPVVPAGARAKATDKKKMNKL